MTDSGDQDFETLNFALQGEIDNISMALQEESWSLVENTIDRLQEIKEKIRAGRIRIPEYRRNGESSSLVLRATENQAEAGSSCVREGCPEQAGCGEPPKPDAWMAYNNAGGAGLVPYLLKARAESNTNLMTGEGPPAYDTDEWPQPLYAVSTIRDTIEMRIQKWRQIRDSISNEALNNDEAAQANFNQARERINELKHLKDEVFSGDV